MSDDRSSELVKEQKETNALLREMLNSKAGFLPNVPHLSQLGHFGTTVESLVRSTKQVAKDWYLEDPSNRVNMSIRDASRLSGISKSTLDRALRELKESGELTIHS